ncbi:class I mannose-6-phosphate isomerase [Chryseolinea soli]|uniref:Mannose-6-phosphate isomerase n=1 Tax=Chryseolinea soli TaxID=2321403 RepID=A0A385SSB8_9BACT|nr:class I mannose-6-phosphate isomerase [Chryseolinea soli]AYB32560.1 mannose-6-phosphate isomerase [Chryseolinea soli]
MKSNFDKCPSIEVSSESRDCITGWESICKRLQEFIATRGKTRVVVAIDCYHGVLHQETEAALRKGLQPHPFFNSASAFLSEMEVSRMVYPDVTDDRIFGFMTRLTLEKFFDEKKLQALRKDIDAITSGVIIVYGEGAAYVAQNADVLVYLDMARWEIQLRMRRNEVGNLGVSNTDAEFSLKYKQAYFVDWRVLDKHKVALMDRWDFVIDSNKPDHPKMITGAAVLKGLEKATHTPFRVVPFFDPGPWGGQWLKEVADLDRSAVNFAWGFDCVPEENSLLLKFGNETVEVPSINLVFRQPEALLGKRVYEKFGAEFPIRFDFLDTMDGGNLSLQVHPTTQYIREHFGMDYTQDESYYMLDTREGAFVYLGLNENADPKQMISELKEAQNEGSTFDAEKYVQRWPIKKHDHVLIPAGTVHCSGKDSVVLEISATPYIFTFKLWDWGRLGLDGKPRPINIEHGEKVIQWDRRETWTRKNLLNRVEKVAAGDGWVEERTGLHEFQFIETRRHWFTKKVLHHTHGGVNVINLVEGREVIIESPKGLFRPYVIHYAETFIVPAAVGEYTITPHGESAGKECATLKAFVRTEEIINGYHSLV